MSKINQSIDRVLSSNNLRNSTDSLRIDERDERFPLKNGIYNHDNSTNSSALNLKANMISL